MMILSIINLLNGDIASFDVDTCFLSCLLSDRLVRFGVNVWGVNGVTLSEQLYRFED